MEVWYEVTVHPCSQKHYRQQPFHTHQQIRIRKLGSLYGEILFSFKKKIWHTQTHTHTQYDWTLKTLHKPTIKGSVVDLQVCKVDMGPTISLFLSCLSSKSESLYALTLSLSLAFSQRLSSLLIGNPEDAWVTCSRAEPLTMFHIHTACPITSCHTSAFLMENVSLYILHSGQGGTDPFVLTVSQDAISCGLDVVWASSKSLHVEM